MVDENKLKKALKLYLVTDSDILKGRDFYKVIEDSMKAGVNMVQLREKDADGKELKLAGKKVKFEVTVNKIVKEVTPELTDDYVKKNLKDILKKIIF